MCVSGSPDGQTPSSLHWLKRNWADNRARLAWLYDRYCTLPQLMANACFRNSYCQMKFAAAFNFRSAYILLMSSYVTQNLQLHFGTPWGRVVTNYLLTLVRAHSDVSMLNDDLRSGSKYVLSLKITVERLTGELMSPDGIGGVHQGNICVGAAGGGDTKMTNPWERLAGQISLMTIIQLSLWIRNLAMLTENSMCLLKAVKQHWLGSCSSSGSSARVKTSRQTLWLDHGAEVGRFKQSQVNYNEIELQVKSSPSLLARISLAEFVFI